MPTKKEIYKENMYKKLMPSQIKQEQEEKASFYYDDEFYGSKNAEMQQNAQARTEIEPKKTKQNPPISAPSKSAVMSQHERFKFVNLQELLVLEKIDIAFTKFTCCDCERCRKDIVAITLNMLPSRYHVISDGEPQKQATNQQHAEVSSAIIKAILIVRTNPRH